MADNLGQYALAKFVQSKTGSYPHLPLADFEPNQDPKNRKAMFTLVDGQLAVNDRNAYSKAVSGPLVSSIDDISSSCDDADAGGDDCATGPPIVFTGVSQPSLIVTAAEGTYESLLQGDWQDFTTAPYTLPPNSALMCYVDVGTVSTVPLSILNPNIADFCSTAKRKPLNSGSALSQNKSHPTGPLTVWTAAQYNFGDPSCTGSATVDEKVCNDQLGIAVNSCDTNSGDKHGGSHIDACIIWSMAIQGTGKAGDAPAVAAPAPADTCKPSFMGTCASTAQCGCPAGAKQQACIDGYVFAVSIGFPGCNYDDDDC